VSGKRLNPSSRGAKAPGCFFAPSGYDVDMAEPKGDRLYANCSAAEARRRLKGFGHGVRKITSGGRNQAVVIHTAYGKNLKELEAKFADVGFSRTESDRGDPIGNLKNLGAVSAEWLRAVGIRTVADLERLGPVDAYRLVRRTHPEASLNLLWAVAAGLADLDWRELPEVTKNRLLRELRSLD
jgi:DNA transformation protein and related proteins